MTKTAIPVRLGTVETRAKGAGNDPSRFTRPLEGVSWKR